MEIASATSRVLAWRNLSGHPRVPYAMETIIALVGILCVAGILWWVIRQIPLPPPADWIVRVVFGVILALALLQFLFGGAGWHFNRVC